MNKVKRLALYIFYDKEGFVSDYVKYYVKALKEVTDRIVFIVNGKILPEGRREIEDLGPEIFNRENKGLDFGAWKETILSLGFEEILKYDELILCNCSSYGPAYPLSEVFSEMESRKCDFWGITKHPATGTEIISGNPASAIVEHIQSYFVVFKRRVVESNGFQKWWKELEPTSNYSIEVGLHENRFTQYLYGCGFSYDTYVDCDKYFRRNCPYNTTFACADELLASDRDPFIKRKLFVNEANVWTETGEGFAPILTMEALKKTSYPVEYIYRDLLRCQKLSSIKDGMALNWIHQKADHYSKHRLALVCYAYYGDLAERMSSYLLNMPEGSDLYLISSKEEVLDAYKKVLAEKKAQEVFGKINFLLKPNRGRDVSSLLVTFAPYVKNYEAFCFVHDKKSKQIPYTLSQDFMRRCLECCLESKEYVKDLVEELFDGSSRTGVMMPPVPYFSLYITLGAEVFEGTVDWLRKLFDMLKLKVPFDDKVIAPFGTMFWARTDALSDLFAYKWDYDDFPEEPMPIDHTISHALERVFCYCAQNRGYFSKWAMPEDFAALYINNLSYRLRDYNAELNRIWGRNSWTGHWNHLKQYSGANFGIGAAPATSPAPALPANAVTVDKTFRYGTYLRYKLLSKITFGHRREHYRQKYMALKAIKRERRIKFF